MSAPIMVAFDGSQSSQTALTWAADEARLRSRPLHVVCAFLIPVGGVPHTMVLEWPQIDDARNANRRMLEDALTRIRHTEPDLEISGEVVDAVAVGATLIEQSGNAELLVLGSRGRGGFAGLVLGSTSIQVTAHAHCPVVVVRQSTVTDAPHPGQVVVGVDGSEVSAAAMRFAFEAAAVHNAELIAVHAWDFPSVAMPGAVMPIAYDRDEFAAREEEVLAETIAGHQEDHPDVRVVRRLVQGDTRRILLDESAGARMLVVGSRGRGGFTGMLLGSTSQAMLHHADAPVVVVRPRTAPEPG